jgi:LEA14-like dessication related protein
MRYSATLALSAVLLLSGCAALEEELARRQPDVIVDSARLGAISFDSAELLADVRIDNPNPVSVNLAGFDYDLQLAGRSLLAGERKRALRIGANEAASIEVPLQFDFADVRDIVRDVGSRDEIDYTLALGLDIDVPMLGTRTIPATTSGTLPVPRLPSVSLKQLRLDELGWSGARATLELAVDNPNTFGLDLDRLEYDLAVNGEAWLSGEEGMTANVPAKGTGRVDIPVQLDFATIGRGAYRLLTGSSDFFYSLNGNLEGVAGDDRLGAFDLDFNRRGAAGIQR